MLTGGDLSSEMAPTLLLERAAGPRDQAERPVRRLQEPSGKRRKPACVEAVRMRLASGRF